MKIDRSALWAAKTVVVKIGSRALVARDGRPDTRRIESLARDVCDIRSAGRDVVLVSSGAIASGLQALGIRRRPTDLPSLQMAAAVGQTRLMAVYEKCFARRRAKVAQILLTHDDLKDRHRHLNARHALRKVLEAGVVPVVNENDAVSVEEIRFGDNDALAAKVAELLEADLVVLLSTVDGYYETAADGKKRRVKRLTAEEIAEGAGAEAAGAGSAWSTGGMSSKIASAAEAARQGTEVVIANGRKAGVLQAVLAGKDVGTWVPAAKGGELAGRRKWVALFHRAEGEITLDSGAAKAVKEKGRSILPVGVAEVRGDFARGALVRVLGPDGRELGEGLTERTADELRLLKGLSGQKIAALLGPDTKEEAIHRDNFVPLPLPARRCGGKAAAQ
jgi:glutamate 5-kinase